MSHPPQFSTTLVLAASCVLCSCAGLRKVGHDSVAMVHQSSTATANKFAEFSLANLLPGQRLKIVQVRAKDLKPMPSGRERALAYESGHRRCFWFFGGPVAFKEPTLPEPCSQLDGSLLPPKTQ